MNILKGVIKSIDSYEYTSLVVIQTEIGDINSIVFGDPTVSYYLKLGKEIYVLFKELSVGIVKKNCSFEGSFNKVFTAVIKDIKKGRILSEIFLNCNSVEIRSIITLKSLLRLNLKEGEEVYLVIKSNEIAVQENNNFVR